MPVVFDHLALAAHRISDAPEFLVGELGGVSGYGGPAGDYRWWHWDYDGGGRIEVIEPDGPPGGFVHRFLERRGPGMHHVNFEVESLSAACERARSLGHTVVGYNDSHPHWREAFLHPKQAMGIVVQIVETSHGDHEEHWEHPHIAGPPGPANAPPPVSVVGLRMRSGDRAAAVRQWGELLEGECEERPDGLVFRWPGSSMRVAVTIEDGVSNQAMEIELRAYRSLRLPGSPHPELGARFRQLSDE